MPYLVPDAVREPLYCIVPYYNPWRWKSREKHTIRAIKHFADSGGVVVLIEAAFNRREFSFADCGLDGSAAQCGVLGTDHRFKHRYIGLRTRDELWIKENLINLAVATLPYDWQQVCWLDSDVHFIRPNWVGECIHKLQHYDFLQMFSQAKDIGPNYEELPASYPHSSGSGWVYAWRNDALFENTGNDYYYGEPYAYPARVWPGLAWAARREAWDKVGGLLDIAIWGGGDWHIAHCLTETLEGMMRNDLHRNYKKIVMQWYHRCRTHIRKNVGMMEGTIFHYWHGRKTERGYNAKHALLARLGFDPLRHLKRDYQGVWQLNDDRSNTYVQLRDMLRRIAQERNEDSNDTRLDLYEQGH